jgi:hypothetical protein
MEVHWLLESAIGSHGPICKGTSICFLTSPLLFYPPPVHMYSLPSPLYHLQGLHLKADDFHTWWSDDFLNVDSLEVNDFCSPPHHLDLNSIGQATDTSGQIHMTLRPSVITWIPIYGRLGTRRLGTVTLCISFVDWPSQGSLEYSLWISLR